MIRSWFSLLLIIASLPAIGSEPDFSVDVMSVLSKAGCNLGTCHGNLNGKGGLKFSLRGQDPRFDYHSLALESRGRRVNRTAPKLSLFLQKATGNVPHRGGVRFGTDSAEYQLLLKWLEHGAKGPSQSSPEVVRLEVSPSKAIVVAPSNDLKVHVIAEFSDGTTRDVTDRACYELSNLKAAVDRDGRVTRTKFGETTLIVRYLQKQTPVSIAFTEARPAYRWNDTPVNNEIDTHVFAKLKELRINPSPLSDDGVFVRRAFLDAIGRAPTAAESRSFVTDDRPGKRQRLVDHLLSRDEFADFWALKWADVLRAEEKVLDAPGVVAFHGWIRDSIATARPLDQFVRDLVTGTGSTFKNPPANFYRANRNPSIRGETTARLFMGTRLQCAKCHNHPFDHWTQQDYYQWSSLFSQIDYEIGDSKRADKLDKNEFPGEQTVLVAKRDEVRNPATGEIAQPKFLGGTELEESASLDRLAAVADWLTSSENDLFAKSQTNFVWYHLMGQGLVDPIDDFRLTNPPTNPALLEFLADDFAGSGFDLRHLIRKIMNSRTYQLSSQTNETNVHDQTGYSRATVKRLPAEVILDLQSDLLATPAGFAGYPRGMRAVQIPGVKHKRNRKLAPMSGDRFLMTFGKPERILACECERSNETTLKQAFVLIGSEGLQESLASPGNRIRQLAESDMADSDVIDELYWSALTRSPTEIERSAALDMIDASTDGRMAALEDIAWALMNAKEFLFRR